MSRTDKDRPWWVVEYQENFPTRHDHRTGECIEEDLAYTRSFTAGGYRRWKHDCKKRVITHWTCTKPEAYAGHKKNDSTYRYCFTTKCDCSYNWREYHSSMLCEYGYRTQCVGHKSISWDNTIPCTCDDWPPVPTCDRRPRYDYTWFRGGAPTWYNRMHWHRPERARERNLRDMALEYNTYGDIEDDDFPNYQHRHEGIWNWW